MDNLLTAVRTTYRPLECRPDSYQGWYQQGNIRWQSGHIEEALLCFSRAIEYHPEDYWAWYKQAMALV